MMAEALHFAIFAAVKRHEPVDPAGVTAAAWAALTDEALMGRYMAGEEAAFAALFARHAGRLYGYFTHRTGSRAQAEDLTQQTWLRVHHARQRFQVEARFLPWLYTIAANLGRSSARAHAREHLTADGALPEEQALPQDLQEPGLSESHRAVRQALLSLPEGQREVILLHRFQGLDFAEIAAALGISEGAVKLRAHRGYQQLRVLLDVCTAPKEKP